MLATDAWTNDLLAPLGCPLPLTVRVPVLGPSPKRRFVAVWLRLRALTLITPEFWRKLFTTPENPAPSLLDLADGLPHGLDRSRIDQWPHQGPRIHGVADRKGLVGPRKFVNQSGANG